MKFDFSKIHGVKNDNLYAKEYHIQISINALRELIDDDDKSIQKIQTEFKEFLRNNNPENIPIQQRDYFEEHLIDRELVINQISIKKRYSSCLLIFSVFEGLLKEFCEEIEKSNTFDVKIKNLKRSDDLTLYKNYLTKIYHINFDKLNPSFTNIKHQKTTRNKIAHKNGIAESSEIQIVNGLKLVNNQIAITSKVYFEYLIDLMDDFFKELLIEIDKK
jgi:hypothetical protein